MGRSIRRKKKKQENALASRHFDPSAVTASARYDTGTFNDDDLPMVLAHDHRSTSSLQHILRNEHRRNAAATAGGGDFTNGPGTAPASHPYLRAFLEDPGIRRAFREEPALASWANKRTLKKEILEGMAALRKVRDELHRRGVPEDSPGLVFFDLCSGKGLLSILLSIRYPRSRICSIDNNPNMVLTHLEATKNVEFRLLDIHSEETAELVEAALVSSGPPAVVVLVGMHLCGALALRAVRIFQRLSRKRSAPGGSCHLVLCPCCLPRKSKHTRVYGHDVIERAAGLGIPSYGLWCTTLCFEILHGTTTTDRTGASMLPDPALPTDKSTFLVASSHGG